MQHKTVDLIDATIVVIGGTGNVGEGVVRSFLKAGANVIVPSRTENRLSQLKGQIEDALRPKLFGVTDDTSSFEGMRAVAQQIARSNGSVDHVVASLGGWWQGKPVWDVSESEFQQDFAQNIGLHFGAARAFAPVMSQGGSYTFIAGLSAIMPMPGVSLVGMYGGAQLMLARSLQADLDDAARVNTLVLGVVMSRNRRAGRPEWISADDAGDAAVRLALSNVRDSIVRLDDKQTAERTYKELAL